MLRILLERAPLCRNRFQQRGGGTHRDGFEARACGGVYMSDPLEDAFVDVAMLLIGGTVLVAGFLAVAIFRAVSGAIQPAPEENNDGSNEDMVLWGEC
jgi:hypothetical protein